MELVGYSYEEDLNEVSLQNRDDHITMLTVGYRKSAPKKAIPIHLRRPAPPEMLSCCLLYTSLDFVLSFCFPKNLKFLLDFY